MPCDVFVDSGLIHPFLQFVVGGACIAVDAEYPLPTVSRRFPDKLQQRVTEGNRNATVCAPPFGLLLIETQNPLRIVNLVISQTVHITPTNTGEAAKKKCTLEGCIIRFESCH